MAGEFTVRKLHEEEIPAAMQLAWQVFLQYEAPGQKEQGVAHFAKYVSPDAALQRAESGEEVVWGAFSGGRVVGMAGFRVPPHITLLFVEGAYQGQGIARQLMQAVATHARHLEAASISVNSSLYGEEAYKRLGFVPTGPKTERDNIAFVPMEMKL